MEEPDLELIDVAMKLIAARTDDRFHTTAAAARAGDSRILTGSAARAVGIDELLPWANGWDPDSGSIPVQE
jgi:hypothetical protein